MKKILTLLAVATITGSLTGCCCRRLCPWLDRGAYCGGAAPFAPLAATVPSVMPSYQPAYQYAAPLAATNPCCPTVPTCATWDPCQGQVNYGYQGAAPAAMPAVMPAASYAAPCCTTTAVEPGCGYMEPYMGGVSYGPMLTSGCDTCGTGYSGAVITTPMPQQAIPVAPGPGE
jgi:hypothetical protein